MPFEIQPYTPSFLPDLYRICLETGDSGSDASSQFTDPDLLGALYAAPYAVSEPDLTFMLCDEFGACGYILGTRDSLKFTEFMNQAWLPNWRARQPKPAMPNSYQERTIWLIHHGYEPYDCVNEYPAHLHIDLLPRAQGQGWGRTLMQTFLKRLHALGVLGVHLGVGKTNHGAITFYQRLGFTLLEEEEYALVMGLRLPLRLEATASSG